MAIKSSIIPILRQFSLKYACRQKVPARLFTVCAGQIQSVNEAKLVGSANVLPRMFGAAVFQFRSAPSAGRSYSRSRKPVSDAEDSEEEVSESDSKEFDADSLANEYLVGSEAEDEDDDFDNTKSEED